MTLDSAIDNSVIGVVSWNPAMVPTQSDNNENEHPADADLVEAIRNGDVRAFRQLIDRHSPTMLRLAAVISDSPESADDIVQDVFMNIWMQGVNLNIRGDVRGYLWNAVRNRARSIVRNVQANQRLHENIRTTSVETSRVSQNSAPDLIEAEELAATVYEGIEGLPKRCRETFLLSWRDGLANDEIAAALAIDVSTVRKQIARAVEHLSAYVRDKGLA